MSEITKDHITKCYSYGKEPHDKDSIDPNLIECIQYDGEDKGKFPWWLHTKAREYGDDSFIEINWTKWTVLVKLKQPKESE